MFKVIGTIIFILSFMVLGVVFTWRGDIPRAILSLTYFIAINQLVGGFIGGMNDYVRQKREQEFHNEFKKEEDENEN